MTKKSVSLLSIPFVCILLSAAFACCDTIAVYFNQPVDERFCMNIPAQGEVSLDTLLSTKITAAQNSVDCCLYTFDSELVARSLLLAKDRGCWIRLITDNDNFEKAWVETLRSHGIPVIHDAVGQNGGWGLMHNKFILFDVRDDLNYEDDEVWTGSCNITEESFSKNARAENVITIRDHQLARAYLWEFEQMWGSSADWPDTSNAKFQHKKEALLGNSYEVDGVFVELYFSPEPNDILEDTLMDAVAMADYEDFFFVNIWTNHDPEVYLRDDRWNVIPFFEVRGVFDPIYWNSPYSVSLCMRQDPTSPHPWDPPADVFKAMVHSKVMLVDPQHDNSSPFVLTGSPNWSGAANDDNDENFLIVYSPDIVNQYLQAHAELFLTAGGSYGDDLFLFLCNLPASVSRGKTGTVDVLVINDSGNGKEFDFWIDVCSTKVHKRTIFERTGFHLPADSNARRSLTLRVPAFAPAETFEITGYVGIKNYAVVYDSLVFHCDIVP
jgi:hypothetical protein